MESEVHELVTAIGAGVSEKSLNAECSDVLLASDSVSTNGISNLSESGAVSYIEEEEEEANENDIVQETLESADVQEVIEKVDDIEELCEDDEIEQDVYAEHEEDDTIEYDDEEIEGENENSLPQKECAQLPKKRKFAQSSAAKGEVDENEEYDEEEEGEGEEEELEDEIDAEEKAEAASLLADLHEDELPTSSRASNKEETVDENICRVCTTKENLVSLFKDMDTQTVADLLMLICPTVSIARKDFMPQYICQPCLDKVTIAVQLKTQCESTERELRKKLSRHKNKVRRPSGYVVIDAPVESDPEEDDEPEDDVEFKVSDVEVSPSADESETDDSDFSSKRKRSRGGGSKRGRKKTAFGYVDKKFKSRGIKRSGHSSDEEFISEKRKRDPISADGSNSEFACDECDQVFTRKLSLVLHKKTHTQSDPIICNLCGKHFKIKGAYRTHMERHKSELVTFSCDRCELFFTGKAELKKHQAESHNGGQDLGLTCRYCKRTFVSKSRLQRHLQNYCPSSEQAHKSRKSEYTEHSTAGKDLFKTVAPLTTTYWSDSFSD